MESLLSEVMIYSYCNDEPFYPPQVRCRVVARPELGACCDLRSLSIFFHTRFTTSSPTPRPQPHLCATLLRGALWRREAAVPASTLT